MEVTDEGGTIDTDYVADITAAQGTWDPWPTPAQDTTPMPAQDALTSPYDDPTPAQDDWRQDSILFFYYLDSFTVFSFSLVYLLSIIL